METVPPSDVFSGKRDIREGESTFNEQILQPSDVDA